MLFVIAEHTPRFPRKFQFKKKCYMNIPFLFTLTLIWAAAKFIGIDTSITGDSQMIGIILIVLTFGTAFAEFYKSSDLSEKSFALDTGFCLLQVIVGTQLSTHRIIILEYFLTEIVIKSNHVATLMKPSNVEKGYIKEKSRKSQSRDFSCWTVSALN